MTTTYFAYIVSTDIDTDIKLQSILVPAYSRDIVFNRRFVSGQRGRGSAWGTQSLDSLINFPQDTYYRNTTVRSFGITDRDLDALNANIVTMVGTKATQALNNSAPNNIETWTPFLHCEALAELDMLLSQGDVSEGSRLWKFAPYYGTPTGLLAAVTNISTPASPEVDTFSTLAQTVVTVPDTTDHLAIDESVYAGKASVTSEDREIAKPYVELATVPPKKWADEYISRKVVGSLTEFDIYEQALNEGDNVLLKGHAGSGKTMSVMAFAALHGLRFYSVSAHSGVEPSQLFGKWNPTGDPERPFAWQDGPVTELIRNGNGVLLLNEVNFLPERFTTVIFSLLDARREIQLMDKDGSVVRAADRLLIIGDMNPNYRGTRQMNQAWNDRFCQHMLNFPYDSAIELKLIPNKSLLDMAQQLRQRFDKEEISTPISTRSLVAFYKNMRTLGFEYAVYSYLNLFSEGERSAVSLVVDTWKDNILNDFAKVNPSVNA